MYLVLRRRLEAVADWLYIDAAVLKTARERRGLSYEGLARTFPMSAKTWERYEKAGRIPISLARKVAQELELEIEIPALEPVVARRSSGPGEEDEVADILGDILREQQQNGELLRELVRLLRDEQEPPQVERA